MTDTDQPYHVDRIYFGLIKDVLENGVDKSDRTGTGTRSVFGRQVRYDLSKGFPILTSKRVHWKSVVGELLWFLQGNTNVKWLNENGITIWDEWADKDGNLGPVYGKQWRSWDADDGMNSYDQIKEVIEQIKINPESRRLIVSAWNVGELHRMALPPCHTMFQFYVVNGKLSCQLYQRSCDLGLGNSYNVASYALLTHMIAHVCDLEVGEFVHTFGDLHVYSNHIEALSQQLHRTPYPMPRLILDPSVKDIDGFGFDKITLDSYQHHPTIKLPVAV